MAINQFDFVVPRDQSFSELLASFQNKFYLNQQPETVSYRVYYDTFDWRLYNNGSVLEVHEEGQSRRIYWRADKNGESRIQLGLTRVPQLASDLAESGFRRQLQSVISVRELIPRIKIKIKHRPMVVLDKSEKAVVRISFDEYCYFPSTNHAGVVLDKRITVNQVKAYKKEFNQVVGFFNPMLLNKAQDNIMKLALAESGISTTEYTTKLNLLLDAEMPAEQALKKILLRLLDIMQQNSAGSIRGRDTEFMHDYRVSIRKTRSALTQIKEVLPQDIISKYNKFFSGLGKLTNPVRDLDVFQIKLDSYQRNLDQTAQKHLQPLRDYIAQSRADAQKNFINTLKSAEYRQSINEWRKYLENTEPKGSTLENTSKAIYILADELVWNIYQLALKEGNAITDDTEAEALHELRKTCKKLRYLMEFFQGLYPENKIGELIQALKGLQDNLGEYNDLHVHRSILKDFIKHSSDADANKSCKQVIKFLKKRQVKIRRRFAERYALFSSQGIQGEFRDLFTESHKGHA
jgi:CHAD domain-containing protein